MTGRTSLKIERELRGISLEEMSEATKIPLSQLIALENYQFGKLPGGLITRGYIKAYVNYLGLDSRQVFLELDYLNSPADTPPGEEIRDNFRGYRTIPIVGFLIILVVLLIWMTSQKKSESAMTPDTAGAAGVKGYEAITTDHVDVHSRLEGWADQNLSLDHPIVKGVPIVEIKESIAVNFCAVSSTWVRTTYLSDGRAILESLFPGDSRKWTIDDEMILEFGNSEAVVPCFSDQGVGLPSPLPGALHFIPQKLQAIIVEDGG
jgi:hypothetical protein